MIDAEYKNHQHYIDEGWKHEPKETFKELKAIIEQIKGHSGLRVLDVGCATGELLGYLSIQLIDSVFVGIDVEMGLLNSGRSLLPEADFIQASALDLPESLAQSFDVVCSVGCMSIFDDAQIHAYWKNLLDVTKPGGLVIVLSPLNEYGVDIILQHRKRLDNILGGWESGWNVFSIDTIHEIIENKGASVEFRRFQISFDLGRKKDPVRTWTFTTEDKERQLTNGLKLLVDHYFIIVQV